MSRLTILTALVAAFSGVATVLAADGPKESPQTAEVRKTVSDLEKKFNNADAKGLAACWAPQGEFIGPDGHRIEGRDGIEKAFAGFFLTAKNAKLRMLVTALRMLGDEAAILDVITLRTPAPTGFQGEPLTTFVIARHQGQWLVESADETLVTTIAHSSHLKGLEGLVGDWAAKSASAPGVSWKSTCDWTANRSFLIRKFSVDGKGSPIQSGTEVIGWDPRSQRIFSWTFESDGGFGESLWVRDGDRWVIKYIGTAADGSDLSVTQVLTRVDADTASLQFIDREVDGVKQPDTAEVQIERTVAQHAAKLTAAASVSVSAMPPRQILP